MVVTPTSLKDVLILEPKLFKDFRGSFFEVWSDQPYREAGVTGPFVQDNLSHSVRNTLRGLHFQEPHGQGKLVIVPAGAVLDVAVDVRKGSPTFNRWVAVEMSAENRRQLWIPKGFAHGFAVLSETATVYYKCTDVYHPECEQTVRWNDPDLAIDWPLKNPILSAKDGAAPALREISGLPKF
ncbi:MAG TPA: dTDP-4-dehydrorhamnose 3,5-epimerase [Bdellovibrionota bacterium]|nr:dTDP-4-dehydrorhamnose 3,5-epimerase [Bdellovibrionota bacterium]